METCLGCSETLAHNETELSRRFGNLQLPSSVIDKGINEVQEAGKFE